MKIFFMSTHCNQGTGYARVANKLVNHLASLPEPTEPFFVTSGGLRFPLLPGAKPEPLAP